MKIKIHDHEKNVARVIEYPLTLHAFIQINFATFGPIYGIEKTGANTYAIYNGFDGDLIYTVSKARKNDPVTE